MSVGDNSVVKLLGLSGSLRKESYNTAVLNCMAGRLCGAAILRVHSLGAVPAYNQDFDEDVAPTAVRELKFSFREADGIVLCSPSAKQKVPATICALIRAR
jgi:chromate reductase